MKKLFFLGLSILLVLPLNLAHTYEIKGKIAQELYSSLNNVFGNSCDQAASPLLKTCEVSIDLIICTRLPFAGAECISTAADPETGEIMIDKLTFGRDAFKILKSMRSLPEKGICDGSIGLDVCHLKNIKCSKSKKLFSKRYTCQYYFAE